MTKGTSEPIETIIQIGAEGGSMTLEGRRTVGDRWQFRLAMNEVALYDMLDEDPPPPVDAPWVSSWDEALELLGRYSWPPLRPLAVHPEFRETVFAALAAHEKGGPDQVARWQDILGS
jgi:hypothetical protein